MPAKPPLQFLHGLYMTNRSWGRWMGRAGVAITPTPSRGASSRSPHVLRANLPHVNLLAGDRPLRMSARRFRYTSGNTSTRGESDRLSEEWCVPEKRGIPQSILGAPVAVSVSSTRAPLLVYGADRDHLTPERMVRRIAARYANAGKDVEYRVLPGRSHLVCGQDRWESLADHIFAWAGEKAKGGSGVRR